ncbi:MAG: carbon-nitrogen hydrolase family protein [Anaerolineae bacterium]|nr:carbon-nitrogen hydrolase family protein [Anaerolineae bacterium]
MREITVATVQMNPGLGEIEDNLVKMSDFISKIASQQKVDLILFPELATSGYELGVKFTQVAQQIPGPTANLISQRAQELGVYIGFGMVTKERVESILYDTAVLVGPDGELIGQYHKTHLKGEERMAFREGYKLPVFETEFGNLGFVLGWDLSFPEVSRSLVLDGAELLCALGNWEKDEVDEWKTYLKARACENACFVAGANRVGEDVTITFGGESMIVGPRGRVHAHLPGEEEVKEDKAKSEKKDDAEKGEDAEKETKKSKPKTQALEGYAVARIDLDEIKKFREQRQTLQTRQPSIYRTLVRRY